MNRSDSQRISTYLEENGYEEAPKEEADLVVINACSIRRSATNRIHGKINRINSREIKPTTILTGCVLKKDKIKFRHLFDHVLRIEDLTKWPLFEAKGKNYFKVTPKLEGISAFVPIMTGCNNFCTYCVVPYTRGKEVSRPAEDIIKEAEQAVTSGHKELWLLGQNVNSYKGEMSFADLLRKINQIKGDFWIRFVSSHPKDFSDDLIKAMTECRKVVKSLNLPVQSGDNEILQKMNRPYTREDYKGLVMKIKKAMPEIELSTDVIVGFPGEKERHFHNTVELFREIQFDMAYISCYSSRPQTAAYAMKETVSDKEKKRRERVLTEILKEITLEKNKKYIGKDVRVLALKINKNGKIQGKTAKNKTVIFEGPKKITGTFVKIKINQVSPWTLKGKILSK